MPRLKVSTAKRPGAQIIIGVGTLLIAFGTAAFEAIYLVTELRFLRASVVTTGRVDEVEEGYVVPYGDGYAPGSRIDYSWESADDSTLRGSTILRSTIAKRYAVGQPVRVRYVEGAPEKSRIIEPEHLIHWILLPTAVIFGFVGSVVLRDGVRDRRKVARLARLGTRCEAVVVDVVHANPLETEDDPLYTVEYEYRDGRGRLHRGTSPKLYALDAAPWPEGERVAIVYDRSTSSISGWLGERWLGKPAAPPVPRRAIGSSEQGDLFQYILAPKLILWGITGFGALAVAFSFRVGAPAEWYLVWPPRLLGIAAAAIHLSYPVGLEIGRDFIRVHYLFGRRSTFALDDIEFVLLGTELTGSVRGTSGVRRLFGSFHIVLQFVPGGDQLLDKLGLRDAPGL